MYQGYLFDLDGTLVESALDFDRIRSELGILPHEDIIHHVNSLPEELRLTKELRLQEIELEAAAQARYFPGAQELLQELKRAQLPIGILTRNCRAVLDVTINRLGIEVDLAYCREDVPAKPDPTGALRFLSQFKLEASETLFVGDYKFDVECGQRAGMKTAVFLQGDKEAPTWGADFAFLHFEELRRHLKQNP